MIAHLGNEEGFGRGGNGLGREAMDAAIGRIHLRCPQFITPVVDHIAFNPGAIVTLGNRVFRRAGAHTVAAADAFLDVNEHGPPMVGHAVGVRNGGFLLRVSLGFEKSNGGGSAHQEKTRSLYQPVAASHLHAYGPSLGLWGWWHVLQSMPFE